MLSGSSSTRYDARGRVVGTTTTVGTASYTTATGYDDAGDVTSQTYPDGQTVTTGYTAQGWLAGVSTTAGGGTTLLSAVGYATASDRVAAGRITSAARGARRSTPRATTRWGGRPTRR